MHNVGTLEMWLLSNWWYIFRVQLKMKSKS